MELTELIRDYVATELLSSIELDFLEGELWETTQPVSYTHLTLPTTEAV